MNPILLDYIQRFQQEPIKYPDKFYTQLEINEYIDKLPYIFEVEIFCLRLLLAYLREHKICIYSDYDTDAVTATATMYWGLRDFGFKEENLTFYAPDRFIEGYGMNPEAASKLVDVCDLIISVDCGINSVKEAEVIGKSNKCDLIITDHHATTGQIPKAMGVINPRLSGFYNQNSSVFEERQKSSQETIHQLHNSLSKESNLDQAKLKIWLEKFKFSPDNVAQNPTQFLSASVTGVGVAWFCLVWFGYMLEEIAVE